MRFYIAGPMTGIPQFNFPAFDAAADALRQLGFFVVSPAELDNPTDRAAAMASPDGSALDYGQGVKKTWGEFLARDVKLLSDGDDRGKIDGVVVLDGWEQSRGARLETFVAHLNGMTIGRRAGAHLDYLEVVPPIELFRAWTQEPQLCIAHSWQDVNKL